MSFAVEQCSNSKINYLPLLSPLIVLAAMRILVTNDDGIFTPGIAQLAEAMSELGEVIVVAPDREMSAISHAFTIMRRIEVKEVKKNWYAVNGTPADCTYIGMHKLTDGPVDLVVSGINNGANLAFDVHYSGTVAGAVEGYFHGARAIAFSQVARGFEELQRDAALATRVAKFALSHEKRLCLSVNFPVEKAKGFRFCSLGRRYYNDTLNELVEPDGRRFFWIEGTATNNTAKSDSDTWAVENGYVSITPLQLDLTHKLAIDTLDSRLIPDS
jgi:5'-nucleotidase